ncbi:MAG: flagellar motor switch protein FliN [Treponema sp.]|nr:flagellar motor switch protein FliN [Treponema sp.]
MSDGAISQAEIDALLSGAGGGLDDGIGAGAAPAPTGGMSIDVTNLNTFAGKLKDPLADNLSKMTGATFTSGNPVVEVLNIDTLKSKLPDSFVTVAADYSNALSGYHQYFLTPEFGKKLTSLMTKEENAELDDMALSVISEVVSKHTGSEVDELDKTGKLHSTACNPAEAKNATKDDARYPSGDFVCFNYPVTVDGQEYTLWEVVEENAAIGIGKALAPAAPEPSNGALSAADLASLAGTAPAGAAPAGAAPMGGMNMNMGGGMMNMGNMMQPTMSAPNVQSLQFPNLQGSPAAQQQGNIGLIMDVFMEMTVELGRTKKQIKDILGMGEGTIIELDKLAGEPVDILVNHKPIAKGEVVVIDENFGVRVTEILSPMERVNTLH